MSYLTFHLVSPGSRGPCICDILHLADHISACAGGNVWQMASAGPELMLVLGNDDVLLQMVGEHQVQNAGAASAVIKALCDNGCAVVNPAQVRSGLESAYLPGRFSLTLQAHHAVGATSGCLAGVACLRAVQIQNCSVAYDLHAGCCEAA